MESTFRAAEEAGLRLAIRGRFIALVIFAVLIISTRADGRAGDFLLLFGAFGLAGLVHYAVIGSRWDRAWIKYVVLTVDIALICYAMTVGPLHPGADIPQHLAFRTDLFPFMFLFLGVSAFSFSPGLILWAGVAISAGWLLAFHSVTRDMVEVVEWSAMATVTTTEQYLDVFLDPNFIATGSRYQECTVLFVTACILSGVMYRARRTVRARIEAEAEREAVARVFGQYVPGEVADRLVRDRGALEPVEREATVLFTDLEGFTAMTERLGPARTMAVLNAYFDAAADRVSQHGGVVTQFQGDAVVATFNVPVEVDDHAGAAIACARAIRDLTDAGPFEGIELRARVGVATGPLVAGSVGGGGRQTYTVHGDTVNLAARLEALNKTLGTRVAIAASSAAASRASFDLSVVGELPIRGQSGVVEVFTLSDAGSSTEPDAARV